MAKKGLFHTVSSEAFARVFADSSSVRDAISRLGYTPVSTSYEAFYKRCDEEGLNVEILRLKGKAERARHNRERQKGAAASLSSLLVAGCKCNRGRLKQRLIEAGLLENRCSNCGMDPEWDGKPLTLVLDHINGVNDDNRIENLRLLCPNCNSQTPTFSGRNGRKKHLCETCGVGVSKGSTHCRKCAGVHRASSGRVGRVVSLDDRPSIQDLVEMKRSMSWGEIGRKYGVSDTAVRKWVRSAGADPATFPDSRKK